MHCTALKCTAPGSQYEMTILVGAEPHIPRAGQTPGFLAGVVTTIHLTALYLLVTTPGLDSLLGLSQFLTELVTTTGLDSSLGIHNFSLNWSQLLAWISPWELQPPTKNMSRDKTRLPVILIPDYSGDGPKCWFYSQTKFIWLKGLVPGEEQRIMAMTVYRRASYVAAVPLL